MKLSELNTLATGDYQNRHKGGNYPAAGKPDTIEVHGTSVRFSFKNTSEAEALKWVMRYMTGHGFKITAEAWQDGDYHDDWVSVEAAVV